LLMKERPKEAEEERSLIVDLKRHTQLAEEEEEEERLYLKLETRECVEEEEEEEVFNHYKNDLERHAHSPPGVAGAEEERV